MAHDRRCTIEEAHSDPDCNVARLEVEVRVAEGWEVTSSCNGCRRSRSIHREDPEVVRVLNIGSVGMGLGSGSEFRLCRDCWVKFIEAIREAEGL